MDKNLEEKIDALCDKAASDGMVFVFGDEVYTPEEAREAVKENCENDMYEYKLTAEQYIERLRGCMADAE